MTQSVFGSTDPHKRLVWTTGQIAKLVHCSPRTASKWIDSGKLKGLQLPGSKHRRVARADLIAFLKQQGLPFDELGVA